jgi:hypothetical protein
MTAENFDRSLRAFQRRSPFRAFTVELVSGHQFRVELPEALVIQGGVGAHIARDREITLLDHEGVSRVFDDSVSQQTA